MSKPPFAWSETFFVAGAGTTIDGGKPSAVSTVIDLAYPTWVTVRRPGLGCRHRRRWRIGALVSDCASGLIAATVVLVGGLAPILPIAALPANQSRRQYPLTGDRVIRALLDQ
jgi:hypothetical protein